MVKKKIPIYSISISGCNPTKFGKVQGGEYLWKALYLCTSLLFIILLFILIFK